MSSLGDKLKSSFATQANLPVMQNKDAIMKSIRDNKVTILASETGSGKTTLTPLFCLEEALNNEDAGKIACTQPRKLAATSVAKHVAQQIGVEVGEEVGYAARFDKNMKDNARVYYTTDSHLLQQMTNDSSLKRHSYILVDEVHERTVPTDLLVAMLKIVVERRNDLKLVIMSATLNAGKFSAFFNDSPIVTLTGRQFQVRTAYMSEPVLNVTVAVVTWVLHIHKTKPDGDILVFMRGADEIEEVCKLLRECPEAERLTALPLYSALQGAEDEVLSASTGRKCIVATNFAETSITIPGVVYVIDSGMCKEMSYNPRVRLNQLRLAPISQSAADQRAGRAGRVRDGICIRLYTREAFDKIMPAYTTPKILGSELNEPVLRMMKAGFTDILNVDMIGKFAPEALLRAIDELLSMGMLNDTGLTPQGIDAAGFPGHPIWYNAILEAGKLGCRSEMFSMAAIAASQHSVFLMPKGIIELAHKARRMFAHPKSDHLTHLNAFHAYWHKVVDENIDMELWCKEHMLNHTALAQIRSIRGHLVDGWKLMYPRDDVDQSYSMAKPDYSDKLCQALARGLFMNTAFNRKEDAYVTIHGNFEGLIEPHSALIGAKEEWIVYTTFRLGAKLYFDMVTAIDPEWIEDMSYFQTENIPKKFGKPKQLKVHASLELVRQRKCLEGSTEATGSTDSSAF
ncbi:pre-mRNA splicing factor ATP-dependent RNA helicase PRP16 [Apiospora sp. TS-2023a]